MTRSADSIDYSAFEQAVTAADTAAYRRRYKIVKVGKFAAVLSGIVFTGVCLYVALLVKDAVGLFTAPEFAQFAGVASFCIILGSAYFAWKHERASSTENQTRLSKFALANQGTYIPEDIRTITQPGMIFDQGSERVYTDLIRLNIGGLPVEIGNYQFDVDGDRNAQIRYFGYMRVDLTRRLPQIVLDAKSNNISVLGLTVKTGLSDALRRSQVLSLEGDFDKYFTLYCPKEYERDALYIFTPDIMALFVDEAALYDVEIVDNYMYVYQSSFLSIDTSATYQRLLQIAEAIGAKMYSKSHRYADERVVDKSHDVVASGGKRLKKDRSRAIMLKYLGIVVFWLVVFVGFILEVIGGNR